MPSRALVALRTMITVQLSAIIAQAGWAAAALGGEPGYWTNHWLGAYATIGLCLLGAGLYLALRRQAGAVNVTLAVLLALAVTLQFVLGQQGVIGAHIFVGVLIAMLATALTSWTYRRSDSHLPVGGRLEHRGTHA